MKENKVYIRKRKPMNLTVADLEESMDEVDEEFKHSVSESEDSEESESDSDDSVREKLEISETESEQDII